MLLIFPSRTGLVQRNQFSFFSNPIFSTIFGDCEPIKKKNYHILILRNLSVNIRISNTSTKNYEYFIHLMTLK